MRRSILIAICPLALSAAFAQTQNPGDYPPQSIMWYVARAKANHELRVELPPVTSFVQELGDVSTVSSQSTMVVAQWLGQCTTFDQFHVLTWTRYRLNERIDHQKRSTAARPAPPLPDCILPAQAGEFVTTEPYGTVHIEGVTVSRAASLSTATLPTAEPRLMFVQFLDNGHFAMQAYGAKGIFSIMPDGNLRSVDEQLDTPLKRDIKERFGGSADRVRQFARQDADRAKE